MNAIGKASEHFRSNVCQHQRLLQGSVDSLISSEGAIHVISFILKYH